MENHELVVAVDGPSGSGKSSVGREVARRCGLSFLDTGAMYRAITWVVLTLGIDPVDGAGIVELARQVQVILSAEPVREYVAIKTDAVARGKEHEITKEIRQSWVSGHVSTIAANLGVRRLLVRQQQDLIAALQRRVVVDGRDITTVVAPDAQLRLILTASQEVRMRRRGLQIEQDHGTVASERQLREQVVERDGKDSRMNEFMNAAEGVVVVDSTQLSFEETVSEIINLIAQKAVGKRRPGHRNKGE